MTSKLRQVIRELLESELDEISTSAGAGGYETPNAFVGTPKKKKKHNPLLAHLVGYRLVPNKPDADDDDEAGEAGESGAVSETLEETMSRYQGFKQDRTLTEAQKIGRAIQEINRQLAEMHRVVQMASRLKLETATPQTSLWKRTAKHVTRMEERLEGIQIAIRELRN